MVCSGWFVVRCGGDRGASCSLSVSLFSGLCRSGRLRALSRGRTASFRPSGGGRLPRLVRPARIGACELGRPLLVSSVGLASCPPSRDRTGRRTRPSFDVLGVMGRTCRELSPECGGRLTLVGLTGEHRHPRVKAIGSKTAASQTGQTLHGTTKTKHGERGDNYGHEAHGTT